MILGNYNIFNANPGRNVGGITDPTYWQHGGNFQNIYIGGSYIDGQTEKTALFNGYLPPYSYGLPMTAGGMSSNYKVESTGSLININLAGGLNAVSTIDSVGTISDANMGLIVSAVATLVGSGLFSADIVGKLEAVAEIASSGDITSSLGALAGLIAEITTSGEVSNTSHISAKGNISADITPFTTLSPENLARAVWDGLATEFNRADTMGEKLNSSAVGGVDYNALAEAVWEYIDRTLTSGGETVTVDYDLIAETVWRTKSLNAKNVSN